MPKLTEEEIESCLMKTKPWKAAGEDGLPAGVWRQVWPVVKESVRHLFQTFLDSGILPWQWKVAKIVPLKKANKDDYTRAKAWRPISLLSTLEKLLEAVVAERNVIRRREARTATHQPLRRTETEVCRAGFVVAPGAHLHRMAEQESGEPSQF